MINYLFLISYFNMIHKNMILFTPLTIQEK